MLPNQQAELYLTTSTTTDICSDTTTSLAAVSLQKWGRMQTLSVSGYNIPVKTWTVLCELKPEFRPSVNLTFPAMTSGDSNARVNVRADGTVRVYNSSSDISNLTATVTFIGQ